LHQPIEFVALFIEVFRILEQEPTRALEDETFVIGTGLVIQLAAEGAELVVEQLDDMEVIEDVHRLGDIVADGADVSLGHVGGDGLDLGMGATQPFEEDVQGFRPFAIADEHHRAGEEIEHDGEIMMSLADVDLVDGDLLEFVQLGFAEAAFKVLGLDFLDGVPADLKMVGHVLDGHVSGQFQGIAFKGTGVMFFGVGKADLGLAYDLAFLAA